MKLLNVLKTKKFFFIQIFLVLYIGINLTGGERGLISYFEKKEFLKILKIKSNQLNSQLKLIENKNYLLSENISVDYLDTLYREKLKYGKKDEILIKLR
jgi:cell division protein DivIC